MSEVSAKLESLTPAEAGALVRFLLFVDAVASGEVQPRDERERRIVRRLRSVIAELPE